MGVQRPGETPELMWSVPLAGVDTGLCRLMVDSVQVAPAFERLGQPWVWRWMQKRLRGQG